MGDHDLCRRLERTWALDAAAFASVLADQDPAWRTETFELAGGHVVLCGPGLYVNRALGIGLDRPLTDDDIDVIEHRSHAVGVPPSVEVTPATHPGTVRALIDRGLVHDPGDDTTAMVRTLGTVPGPTDPRGIVITPVSERSLAEWQAVSALGWGRDTESTRRASDAFARAAAEVDGDGMVLAFDATDQRPLGCASLTIRNGIATLGGMSTIPTERGRGVQSALIHHRLRLASAAGCEYAASTVAPGGPSERNLMRHGFSITHTKSTFTRPSAVAEPPAGGPGAR